MIVVDDGSTDDTAKVCEQFDPRISVKYIKIRKGNRGWTDCAFTINEGIRSSTGSTILLTHPEIMPGRQSVAWVCDGIRDTQYRCCKGYYLTERDQDRIDTVDWMNEGPLAARKIEGFYDQEQHVNSHPDYTPWGIESVGKPGGHAQWESWIFGGLTRRTLSHMGGWFPTTAWGTTDILFLQRRRLLGIETVTGIEDSTIVVHANHNKPVGDFVPTDRDMAKCFAQAPVLTREQCLWPLVDEIGWGPLQ